MQNANLKAFIKSKNMTQEEFASLLGMRRETISRIVSGSEPVSANFIGSFFRAFGAAATEQVFDGAGQPTPAEMTAP